ncbi:MAG: prepilin peptidase [Candidatus Omnitrophota bacterium]|nr:prepilin peptidase [Candidatus Omnitrophota bacterium]
MPRNESLVFPGSRCVSCKKPIPWYDNIPLLSYLILRGRCRSCNASVSPRYFFVELISALCFVILFINFGFNYIFWIYSLLTFSLIVVTFIDLEFQIIPGIISIGGIFLGVALSIFFPLLQYSFTWKVALFNSILGVLIGGGLIYITRMLGNLALFCFRHLGIYFRKDSYWRKIFSRYRHMKESMGLGDVELMAMLGAFLGWKMAILIFFLAPFFGAPIGIYMKFVKKEDIIPYGPYISLAGFVAMVWGHKILSLLL